MEEEERPRFWWRRTWMDATQCTYVIYARTFETGETCHKLFNQSALNLIFDDQQKHVFILFQAVGRQSIFFLQLANSPKNRNCSISIFSLLWLALAYYAKFKVQYFTKSLLDLSNYPFAMKCWYHQMHTAYIIAFHTHTHTFVVLFFASVCWQYSVGVVRFLLSSHHNLLVFSE